MNSVSLSDLGIVCSLGYGIEEVSNHLFQGSLIHSEMAFRCKQAKVPVGQVDRERLPHLPQSIHQHQCINHRLLYAAWLQIENAVQKACAHYGASRVGIVLGSSTSGLDATEAAFYESSNTGSIPAHYQFSSQHEMGSMVDLIRSLSFISGPGYVISTACSSSAKAMVSARSLILMGVCDAVVCGGADALCHLTLDGFDSLASISSERTLPFSPNRKGLNLGEGAALFLMEKKSGGISLVGVGESTDAHHLSAPHPEGLGAEMAMRAALHDANLLPEQISYVNLHGTGTPLNDSMESKAISRLFGNVLCSSTKPMTGHTLGAAGAIEAALCWITLCQSSTSIALPPHINDEATDPAIPLLSFCTVKSRLTPDCELNFMSSSYAFGGNNCALILQRKFT